MFCSYKLQEGDSPNECIKCFKGQSHLCPKVYKNTGKKISKAKTKSVSTVPVKKRTSAEQKTIDLLDQLFDNCLDQGIDTVPIPSGILRMEIVKLKERVKTGKKL